MLGLLYNDFVLSITSNATIAKYDVTRNTIVTEYLVYKARSSDEVEQRIVSAMQKRQQGNLSDKQSNSLICLPAAPGSGKSTFMARFPETTGFKNYVQNRSSMPCVVIPITFNSRMNKFLNDADTIGLRMLYGASISMSDKEEYYHTWISFSKKFQEFASLKALEAVNILRRVYGDRRMLLLVDELSKAKRDKAVMSEIGVILDGEPAVDVLVSSLSPNYIATLVTARSQRPVEFVVLPPLIEEKLGRKETKRWATKVLEDMKKGKEMKQEVPPFLSRMVSSVYLFASGHPRSIEKLLESLDENLEEWKNVIKLPNQSILSKMYNLADLAESIMTNKTSTFSGSITARFILEEVLSHKTYKTQLTPKLRKAVENGFIYLGRDPQRSAQYSPNIRLGSLLDFLRDLPASPPPYPNTKLALRVLGDNLNPNSTKGHLSTLFERCIAFNILVRQKDRFGVVDLTMDEYNSTWTFRRCEADEDLLVVKMNEV
eukprot:scaffold1843_cov160-Ochromonas_danica.AAC.1